MWNFYHLYFFIGTSISSNKVMTGIRMTSFLHLIEANRQSYIVQKQILLLLTINILLRLRRYAMNVSVDIKKRERERERYYMYDQYNNRILYWICCLSSKTFVVSPFSTSWNKIISSNLWLSNLTRCEIITRNKIHEIIKWNQKSREKGKAYLRRNHRKETTD